MTTLMALTRINFAKGPLMTEFNRNIRITFTPGARAVLAMPSFQVTQYHQCALLCARGDLMQFPGCEAYFVVLSRKWTVSAASESLDVILDLSPDAAPVRAVT
jgi:hypothetical protein